jgi:hypothetical protein
MRRFYANFTNGNFHSLSTSNGGTLRERRHVMVFVRGRDVCRLAWEASRAMRPA